MKYRTMTAFADRCWFTADLHFFHAKAAEWRGYITKDMTPDERETGIDRMNTALIDAWNRQVPKGPSHDVFILGDVAFAGSGRTLDVLRCLNGRLHLIRGNHDKGMNDLVLTEFYSVHDLVTVKVQEATGDPQRITLCHFPMLVWDMSHHGAWHLHGHSHGSAKYPEPRGKILDVGVDATSLPQPLSYWTVKESMGSFGVAAHDHHRVREAQA